MPVNNYSKNNVNLRTEVVILNKFEKNGRCIFMGTVVKGTLQKKQIMYLGPLPDGQFIRIEIMEIHCYKIPVRSANCGQTCTIAIKEMFENNGLFNTDFSFVKKGTVLVDGKEYPKAYKKFIVKINDFGLGKDITLKKNYEPLVYSQTFRQSCEILDHKIIEKSAKKKSEYIYIDDTINIEESYLKKKKKKKSFHEKDTDVINFKCNKDNILTLKFKFAHEFILKGQKILINDDLLQAVGYIIELIE